MAHQCFSKLQDIVAHCDEITCLSLGQKTVQLFATGSADKSAMLWKIDKPHSIMSLTGHTSAVTSVCFNLADELLMVGTQSGTIKIWDLEEAKVMRTLACHKAAVPCAVFHPYADIVATGSLDSGIKLWDMRRKGMLFQFRGHKSFITSLNFSPDGRWLASTSDDSSSRIWDLQNGKTLADLNEHSGSITSGVFHPNEFLYATCSLDKTVKFWDLESFCCVGTSPREAQSSLCISFDNSGRRLYSAGNDFLKVYSWEPVLTLDSVTLPWDRVSTLGQAEMQLIAASFSNTSVSTYVVDLNHINTDISKGESKGDKVSRDSPMNSSRKNYTKGSRPSTSTTYKADKQDDDDKSMAQIDNADDYNAIFKAKFKLNHDPVPDRPPTRPTDVPSSRPYNGIEQPIVSPPDVTPAAGHAVESPQSIDPKEFMPKNQLPISSHKTSVDIFQTVEKGYESVKIVLSGRNKNLQTLRTIYSTEGNWKRTAESAARMNDMSLMADLLNMLLTKSSIWTLDLASVICPSAVQLTMAKYDAHIECGVKTITLIVLNFGNLIKTTLKAQTAAIGPDISREDRYNKCEGIFKNIIYLRDYIDERTGIPGKVGLAFKELRLLLNTGL